MPATPWTELTAPDAGWLHGFIDPSIDPLTDLYIDVLFEGVLMLVVAPTPYTQLSLSGGATPSTELTAPAVSWTELTG